MSRIKTIAIGTLFDALGIHYEVVRVCANSAMSKEHFWEILENHCSGQKAMVYPS